MTTVIVTLRRVGFHQWLEAPKDVDYLREVHRHEFSFRIEAAASHLDRAVEFHTFKRAAHHALLDLYDGFNGEMALGERSCEMVARDLMAALKKTFPVTAVEVWEDGECGARVEAAL